MRLALLFAWYLCCTSLSVAAFIPDNELENLSLLIDAIPLSFFSNSQIPEQQTLFAFLCTVDKKQLGIIPANFDRCLISGSQGIMESASFTHSFKSQKSLYGLYSRSHQTQANQSPWSFQNDSLCYLPFEDGNKVCLLPYIQKLVVERSLDSLYSGSGFASGSEDREDMNDATNNNSTPIPPAEEDPYKDLKTIGITVAGRSHLALTFK